LPFLSADGITDFGIALANTAISFSALSFYKSTDQTCGGINGLTSFICLWCNKNSSHRRKSAFPPYVTLYGETKVAVRLRLPPDRTRSYGIIDTKQQPQQN